MKRQEYGLGKVLHSLKDAAKGLDKIAHRVEKNNLWKWRLYLQARSQITDLQNYITK